MDFVVIEIFYLLWFSLGTFGTIRRPPPINQAVLNGIENVPITCVCSGNPDNIKWSFTPAGSTTPKLIKDGSTITDDAFGGSPGTDGQSYTLTVKNADSSTAGTYTCEEHGNYSALLIVFQSVASCDISPKNAEQHSCDSTLELSCKVSYIANADYVAPNLQWYTDNPNDDEPEQLLSPTADDLKVDSWPSGTFTTATSRLNVKWPKEGGILIYTCAASFTVSASAITRNIAKYAPPDPPKCQPFTSPVPCIDKDGNLRTGGPSDKSETDDSSVRSAETSNLAIRVLSVAGVLLLAQMF